MQRVLITGGGGYIGTILTEELLNKHKHVTCLDRFFLGKNKISQFLDHPAYQVIHDDIRNLDADVLKDIDIVVDLAALSNDPLGEIDIKKTLDINYHGRMRVNTLARKAGVKKYILASSCSVYGFNEAFCDETSELSPISTYAKSSREAEACLEDATDDYCVTVLRFATVFGVSYRMRFDLAINLMTLNAFKEGKIFIMGQGMQWRPFVHVRDVAEAIIHVIEADDHLVNKQVFNVGSNKNNRKIIHLAYMVREALPFEIRINIAPDDPDKRSYRVNFDKISKMLNFTPRYSIEDGIEEIYNALKKGKIWDYADTFTVKWYSYLLNAHKVLQEVVMGGEVL